MPFLMPRRHWVAVCLLSIAVAVPTLSQAGVIYDLKSDFSNAANPNGAWTFKAGGLTLSHFSQPVDANSINVTAGNGYWGFFSTFSGTPFVYKATQDGSSAPGFTNNDFLTGDVIVHSNNPPGSDLLIMWTAPGDGEITYSGSVWYAHRVVNRINDYFLELNGGPSLASGTITNGDDRNNADTFASAGSLPVLAGDVLALRFKAKAGQVFGSLAGANFTVEFTAVPEVSVFSLLGLASVGALGLRLRQSRRN